MNKSSSIPQFNRTGNSNIKYSTDARVCTLSCDRTLIIFSLLGNFDHFELYFPQLTRKPNLRRFGLSSIRKKSFKCCSLQNSKFLIKPFFHLYVYLISHSFTKSGGWKGNKIKRLKYYKTFLIHLFHPKALNQLK